MPTLELEAKSSVISLPPEADTLQETYLNERAGERGGGFTQADISAKGPEHRIGFKPPIRRSPSEEKTAISDHEDRARIADALAQLRAMIKTQMPGTGLNPDGQPQGS